MGTTSHAEIHAVLVSVPNHITPVLELSKRLVTLQSIKVTVIVVSTQLTVAKESRLVESVRNQKLHDIIHLPPVDADNFVGIVRFIEAMKKIKPAMRSALSALESPPTALFVQHFGAECLDIADEFKIPKFVFITSHAWSLALEVYAPVLDKLVEGNFAEQKDPFLIPGCSPLRPEEMVSPLMYRHIPSYAAFLDVASKIPNADGILVNTWEELEPNTLAALRDEKLLGAIVKAPVYTVGPMCPPGSQVAEGEIFEWLDKQPRRSVVYIAFGSAGALSQEQTTELAHGLELSQQRFIWVVGLPATKTGPRLYKESVNQNDPLSYLPEGFLDRTRDRGMVIPKWAPQMAILSHPSTGACFTHCGYNTIVESIMNELLMIGMPLYAEQGMNSSMITEDFGIAVRPKVPPTMALVERQEIATMVRRVMQKEEGQEMRERVKAIRISGEKAWGEGGSSRRALDHLTEVLAARCSCGGKEGQS